MPQIDRAAGLRVKIERAKEHIRDLETECSAFLKTDPYLLIPKTEIQTGESVIRVTVRAQPPPRLGAIAGDAIHNLRAALDLLVYQLALANGTIKPKPNVKLPVADHPNKFEAALREIQGLSQQTVSLIKALRPYKGGNDLLWLLHRLDIIDKHHVLLLVGGAAQVITFDRQRSSDFAKLLSPNNPTWWSSTFVKVITPSSKIMHTLEHEAELFRGYIDLSNVNMEPHFAFHVAFSEPEIVKGQPVVATLHQFVNLVEGIIEPFRPLLV